MPAFNGCIAEKTLCMAYKTLLLLYKSILHDSFFTFAVMQRGLVWQTMVSFGGLSRQVHSAFHHCSLSLKAMTVIIYQDLFQIYLYRNSVAGDIPVQD